MKKGILKHLLASALLILPLALQAGMGVQTVVADTTTDESTTVNITLHKLAFEEKLPSGDVQNDGQNEPELLKSGTPLEGATFSAWDVTEAYQTLLSQGETAQKAQDDLQSTADKALPDGATPVEQKSLTTDSDGLAKFTDLPKTSGGHNAVYLFLETGFTPDEFNKDQTVVTKATPMVVALPLYTSDNKVNEDIQIYPKDVTEKTVSKDVTEVNKTDLDQVTKDKNNANNLEAKIGDTVSYSITVAIPFDIASKDYFDITDTAAAGLKLTDGTVKLKLSGTDTTPAEDLTAKTETADGDYTITTDNNTFKISLMTGDKGSKTYSDAIKKGAGQTLTITYDTTITKDAAVDTALDNTVSVLPGTTTPTITTHSDHNPEVGIATFKKVDADGGAPLAGAHFLVTRKNGDSTEYLHFDEVTGVATWGTKDGAYDYTTKDDGLVTVTGLDYSTGDAYSLEETEAPEGYVQLTEPVAFDVTHDSDTIVKEIDNTRAGILPHTGGMGIYIIIAVGVVIMGAAVIVLRRGNKHTEV